MLATAVSEPAHPASLLPPQQGRELGPVHEAESELRVGRVAVGGISWPSWSRQWNQLAVVESSVDPGAGAVVSGSGLRAVGTGTGAQGGRGVVSMGVVTSTAGVVWPWGRNVATCSAVT